MLIYLGEFLIGDGIVQIYCLELSKGLIDRVGKSLIRGECQLIVRRQLDSLARRDIYALARLDMGNLKGADSLHLDRLAVDQTLGDGSEQFTQE